LLEAMGDAPDHGRLATLDQPQLASIYAERMTQAAFAAPMAGSSTLKRLSPTDSNPADIPPGASETS
jgi:hypothetical protein